MSTQYKTQTLGFKRESTYGTDPISLASTEYWKLGKQTIKWGEFPSEDRQLTPMYTGATRTPQEIFFGSYHAQFAPATVAVNAIPLYLALGKVTNAGAGDPYTHTITNQVVGSALPYFTIRSEDANGSVGIYESVTGSYVKNMSTSIDFSNRSNQLTYTMQTVGQKIVPPASMNFSGASDAGSLVFPGGLSDDYMFDSNTAVKWNSSFSSGVYSSGGDDITNETLNWSFMVDNDLRPDKPHDQDYPDNYKFGTQTMVCSFDMLRVGSTTKNVYDDFVTMQDNTTTANLHVKLYQDATHYIQFDMSDFTLGKVSRQHTRGTNEIPTFRCSGMFKTIKVTAVDSLVGATYYA